MSGSPSTSPEIAGRFADLTSPAAIEQLLDVRFGVATVALDRIPLGQGTVNYRATTVAAPLFVKAHPAGTDLAQEAAGIRLSALAAQAGIPAAEPLVLADGTHIATHHGSAASVFL